MGIDPNFLQVSSLGWIRARTKGNQTRVLGQAKRGCKQAGGYRVHVGSKLYLVHRLVALAFLGPPPSKEHTVDHIDQDRYNNAVSNLRWASRRIQRLNQGSRKPLRTRKTLVVTLADGSEELFGSVADAAAALRVDKRALSQSALKGCRAGEYRAKYAPLETQEDLPGERWVAAICDPNRLRVSTMGRLQRLNDIGNEWGYKLTPVPSKGNAYAMVRSKSKSYTFHIGVKRSFDDVDDASKYVVDHINRNKSDNRLENLAWASNREFKCGFERC